MSLLNSIFGTTGVSNNNIANSVPPHASGASGSIAAQTSLLQGQLYNNAQNQLHNNNIAQNQIVGSYPYITPTHRALHIIVKQVENGYTIEIGGSIHIAGDLKEITDLLTNRVAATLLDWNP